MFWLLAYLNWSLLYGTCCFRGLILRADPTRNHSSTFDHQLGLNYKFQLMEMSPPQGRKTSSLYVLCALGSTHGRHCHLARFTNIFWECCAKCFWVAFITLLEGIPPCFSAETDAGSFFILNDIRDGWGKAMQWISATYCSEISLPECIDFSLWFSVCVCEWVCVCVWYANQPSRFRSI